MPFRPERTSCEPCPNLLMDIVNINGECETCPEGSFPNGIRHSCIQCQADEILSFDDSCKKCPEGMVPSSNRKFCKPCPKTMIANEGVCQPCPNPDKE